IPPAFIGLLSGGVSTMVWVIVIYSVANFVIQTILQPKFTGDAVGINASTAFLSLMFWAYVFGALGALLAIPFTLLVKTLLIDRDPKTRWITHFMSSNPRLPEDHPSG
ncbi:MAG: AI-2E family transporter, partial [Janibacter sp.]